MRLVKCFRTLRLRSFSGNLLKATGLDYSSTEREKRPLSHLSYLSSGLGKGELGLNQRRSRFVDGV